MLKSIKLFTYILFGISSVSLYIVAINNIAIPTYVYFPNSYFFLLVFTSVFLIHTIISNIKQGNHVTNIRKIKKFAISFVVLSFFNIIFKYFLEGSVDFFAVWAIPLGMSLGTVFLFKEKE